MSAPTAENPLNIISLGAGVQSSCMALMAARGLITPMPNSAVFADTQWEQKHTYEWLDWLEKQLPFPVVRLTSRNIRDDQAISKVRGRAVNGERVASLPFFTKEVGKSKEGKIRRQCTREYKIDPIERWMARELLGLKHRQRRPKVPVIIQWLGISTDEAHRMKDSTERWYSFRYPLALELGMSRHSCREWVKANYGKTPPRSACIGCPLRNDRSWLDMQRNNPDEFADAVEFDRAIRKCGGMIGDTFVHRSCQPLDQVNFNKFKNQPDLFGNLCGGFCGT